MSRKMKKALFFVVAAVGVGAFALLSVWLFNSLMGANPHWDLLSPGLEIKTPSRSKAKIMAACQQHIDEADKKAAQAVAIRSKELGRFVQSRKAGARPFAEDLISLRGKWRVIRPGFEWAARKAGEAYNSTKGWVLGEAPQAPAPSVNSHKAYIMEKFGEHIFTEKEFEAAMNRIIMGCIHDMEAVENELAVALRREILGRRLTPGESYQAAKLFKQAGNNLVLASRTEAIRALEGLAVSEASSIIAGQVFLQILKSMGWVKAGATASVYTFGVSIIIGIAADMIWNWITDPEGKIEQELLKFLDQLADEASLALHQELTGILSHKSQLWNQTLKELVP
ncbi:MAG: hypothetical protein QMD09_14720 [Desulfatibacillaceae bacterium]|nr:hypothetical protein [Desulfatibacillaceae bacterium]